MCKEIIIELVKISFTALIGFVTFKIYQMYRNKKDNSKLYIQTIKLEREIKKNLQLLEAIIDNHSRYHILDSIFKAEKEVSLYTLYELVNSLNQYVYQDIVYEKGEPVDAEHVYIEKPYEIIEQLNYMRNQIESEGESYSGQLDDIDSEIKKQNEKSIFNLFVEIEKSIESFDIDNYELSSSIKYLRKKVNVYNSNDIKYKRKTLDDFCSKLLDGNNAFSESLLDYKEYKDLSRKLHKEKPYKKIANKLVFKVWHSQDMDLLGVYSTEDYLKLEEFYHKYSFIEIGDWQLDRAEELKTEIQFIYDDKVNEIKNKLKKTLKRTNWLFRKI
jgi:hypothetical protein